jgi:hypothetical protein
MGNSESGFIFHYGTRNFERKKTKKQGAAYFTFELRFSGNRARVEVIVYAILITSHLRYTEMVDKSPT